MGCQLHLGVFGEGGTGKSQLIKAIQAWFRMRHRSEELVVTATNGDSCIQYQRHHSTQCHESSDRKCEKDNRSQQRKALGPVALSH